MLPRRHSPNFGESKRDFSARSSLSRAHFGHFHPLILCAFRGGLERSEPILWAEHRSVDSVRWAVLLGHPEDSNGESNVRNPSEGGVGLPVSADFFTSREWDR